MIFMKANRRRRVATSWILMLGVYVHIQVMVTMYHCVGSPLSVECDSANTVLGILLLLLAALSLQSATRVRAEDPRLRSLSSSATFRALCYLLL